MGTEPSDELTDNVIGDLTDSLATGIFANLIMRVVFGKNPSMKSILSMDTLRDGAKLGGGIALYRRVGRPAMNKVMGASGLENMLKV